MSRIPKERRPIVCQMQMILLRLLKSHRPVPVRTLADELEVHPSTVGSRLAALREMGIETRAASAGIEGPGIELARAKCPLCGLDLAT
jgi:predicted ArsR family transcriptional regulator